MLQESFTQNTPEMSSEIANFMFTSKYARYREDLSRRETWNEAVSRVEDMHLRKFDFLPEDAKQEIVKAFNLVRDKKVLPSMRSLQYGGKAMEHNNARGYNCALMHLETIRNFEEYFFLLLSGCGVGVGLTERHLKGLPDLKSTDELFDSKKYIYRIEDDIEGWSDSIGVLLRQYLKGYNSRITFDYSLIRQKGSPLKTSGGIAPGPDGLKFAHQKIEEILSKAVQADQKRLTTVQVYDILMHIADAVLSGGVRRSAVMIIFDKNDQDMMTAKSGDWFKDNPQRARSNNSVLFLRNETSAEEIQQAIQHTKEWGEPGFIFANDPDQVMNPCGEISCIPSINGEFGVQFCNLTTINGTTVIDDNDLYERAKAAAIIGTLQAAYTKFPYLSSTSEQITKEEALLGVSILGVLSNPLLYNPTVQRIAAMVAVNTNKLWADRIGINQAARVTCIKPDGQSSLTVGSMFSGIHPVHDFTMFRRIQVNKQDPVYQHFKTYNPHMCSKSAWAATDTDEIITFPVLVSPSAKTKSMLTDIEHLEIIRRTQKNWVTPGITEVNSKPISHSVSCTVQVDDWQEVAKYLAENKDSFCAVSLIARNSDKQYKQAPNESVTTAQDALEFNRLMDNYTLVDYTQLVEQTDQTKHQEQFACIAGACTI